ncbi:hypothetical protein P7K49_029908, partial [Saguinus oedipus]
FGMGGHGVPWAPATKPLGCRRPSLVARSAHTPGPRQRLQPSPSSVHLRTLSWERV